MPSQKQLRWSQLRVGITVVAATITLAVLIFFMSGTAGLFTSRLTLITFYDNAEGLIVGAPVALHGVTIGNVSDILVVPNRPKDPVQVTMKVNTKYRFLIRKDTKATVQTVGVLGQSFIDFDSTGAKGPEATDGTVLPAGFAPAIGDVVKSTQSTLQNVDILIRHVDEIVQSIENSKGTLGQFINDPSMFNRLNSTLTQIQKLVNDVSNGKGDIGKLFVDESLYHRVDSSLAKLETMIDDVSQGKGNLGKLLKDETLYNNVNQAAGKGRQLMEDIDAGKGAIGKLAKDQELAKKLDNIIQKLSAISDKLAAGEGTLGKFLQDPAIYNHTEQLLSETRELIKAVRENPKKYLTIHLKVF